MATTYAASAAIETAPSESLAAPESVACLYCGGSNYAPLHQGIRDRLGFVPGDWAFLRCLDCGSAILDPMPRPEEIASLYPPIYTFSPELAKVGTLKRWLARLESALYYDQVYRAQLKLVDRHVRKPGERPGRLLDIGCGRGRRLLQFRKLGYEVAGLDLAAEAVEYVNETLRIPAVCSDISGLARHFEHDAFDLITAFYVLEHITNVEEALRECLDLLRPGGWLVAAIPLADSTQAHILGRSWTSFTEAPRHLSVPTQSAFLDLCCRCGFDRDETVVRPDSVLGCAGVAALSLLPASATTTTFSAASLWSTISRLAAPLAVAACIPWAAVDAYCFGRSGRCGLGLVFARKPRLAD